MVEVLAHPERAEIIVAMDLSGSPNLSWCWTLSLIHSYLLAVVSRWLWRAAFEDSSVIEIEAEAEVEVEESVS
jgi:hypothetical protein